MSLQNKKKSTASFSPTSVTAGGAVTPTQPPTLEELIQPQYRHVMRPVPPYALERLARAYYKDTNKKDKSTENGQNNTDSSDPFLRAIDHNWSEFLRTVEATPAYANDTLEKEHYKTNDSSETLSWNDIQANLEGKWGGDERLRLTFNSGTPNLSPYDNYNKEKPDTWFKFWKGNETDKNGVQHRTKAGYWMSTENRGDLKSTMKRILLSNPYIPLFFRILEIVFSAVALGLATRIFVLSNRQSSVGQQPSTIMAICVQSVAIVYLLFIARDEFGGRPLGLRDPLLKLRLILLDLLFIIFSSANLSLAFNTLFDDRWVCVAPVSDSTRHVIVVPICHQQKGLASFLFVMLCMWVVTFTISILRVVEKVATPVLSVHK